MLGPSNVMLRWFATIFGIGADMVAEVPWVADWIKRHHNSLRHDETQQRWFWSGED
jgi:hypothetical protein